jgi:hypothetical protein
LHLFKNQNMSVNVIQTRAVIDIKLFLITFFGIILLISCSSNRKSDNSPGINTSDTTIQLGNSEYYIIIPKDFEVTEARGKEGQLGYVVMPKKDTTFNLVGFIEIKKGHGINPAEVPVNDPKEFVSSDFLGKKISWTIGRTETGYFNAKTPEDDITANISSKDKEGIDKLITMFSTVRKK